MSVIEDVKKQIGSVDFSANHNTAFYGPTGSCGYPEGRTDVSSQYIISVKSDAMDRTVRALLQEDFLTSVQSTWADPSMAGMLAKFSQDTVQMVTGYGVGSQFMTRRIWHSSSPMKLQIKLKFEAIQDAWQEVVLPCATLQQMALPSKFRFATQERGLAHEFFENVLIVPPGPNPFYISAEARAKISEVSDILGKGANWVSRRAGDIITIQIGGLMSFKSVIVRSVEVLWKKRFNKDGKSTGAVATVNFESFEIYTKDDIANEFLYPPMQYGQTVNRNDLERQLQQRTGVGLATPPISAG